MPKEHTDVEVVLPLPPKPKITEETEPVNKYLHIALILTIFTLYVGLLYLVSFLNLSFTLKLFSLFIGSFLIFDLFHSLKNKV